MLSHLRSEYLATAMLDKPRWLELKRQLLLARPELRPGRQPGAPARHPRGPGAGHGPALAEQEAARVFAALAERSKIEVSEATHRPAGSDLRERYPWR